MHLIEADEPAGTRRSRRRPGRTRSSRSISDRLSAYVSPYDPETWRSPKDAMAHEFYRWERGTA